VLSEPIERKGEAIFREARLEGIVSKRLGSPTSARETLKVLLRRYELSRVNEAA
jgi:hypothetical protein